ncbi:glycosyl hydrolase family 3 [Streptomyces cellostaticus]|uniref:Glycosyl hydrolase family 3 n=1 Tax=Streptomyces cellostaticus TaxID=67285 RepID=A0A101NI63_9ACTN|nr:glycoside hydrolase family 3 C-terminal domain-containing protein [Streptomyces cellostaticus]KUM93529.1 glycosyl hydrolase family 3 [Streptomyces cellostaticus]GHI04283.1 glycosyl hydrolase [Streptomyces cellostaticus]
MKRRIWVPSVFLTVLALLNLGAAPGSPGREESRADRLVAQMTLDEKLSFVHWGYDTTDPTAMVYLPGVPRLGIPKLRATDGPAGVTIHRPSLAMPAPVSLASSFDDGLAEKYGQVLGREGRAFNMDVLFAPMVNSIRVPQAGRNFETFSEDPLLTGRTAAAEIKGIQSQGLMATVKHYAANTQENNRMGVDVKVDDRTLHEMELPGFEAAAEAGTASVMCAYPKVNGEPACGNGQLLNGILREQLKFQGFVTSDWLATHSTDAITKGLDQELGIDTTEAIPPGGEVPGGKYFGDTLKKAVTDGTIPLSVLDRSVNRIVGQMDRFGLLDKNPPPRPQRDLPGGTRVAQKVAESGAVLLRNQDRMLPLDAAATDNLAVIGPTAKTPKVTGLGSSYIVPDVATAPLDTITKKLGAGAHVSYAEGENIEGEPIPASALQPAFAGGTVLQPAKSGVIYDGKLTVDKAGLYRIAARVTGGNGAIQIDNGDFISIGEVFGKLTSVPLKLTAGTHTVKISGGAVVGKPMTLDLSWVTPAKAQEAIDQAVATARKATTAVVFAYDDGAEGSDRTSLSLPGHQDELIKAVTAANPRTVVVLNTGSSVTMPWLDKTRAVLDMWYPGQAGAEATADLLFGDAEPGGRLSQTFPASEQATPVAGDPGRYPGVDGVVRYSEGIYSGYRWYDHQGVKPLFPFGFGLSYTSFAYEDQAVKRTADGFDVDVTVRNTGNRPGSEVVQVYLGPSGQLTLDQADKALAGYQKVELKAGESRRVHLHVAERALQYWDTSAGAWKLGGGERRVLIGSSSDQIRLTATVRADRPGQ